MASTRAFWTAHFCVHTCPQVTLVEIMKRKFKQGWSTIQPISTKQQLPIIFSLNTTSDVGNPAMACDRYKNVAGLKLQRFASTQKDHILSQKRKKI